MSSHERRRGSRVPPRRRSILDASAIALISLVSPILTGAFGTVFLIGGQEIIQIMLARGLGTILLICCAVSLWATIRALHREL